MLNETRKKILINEIGRWLDLSKWRVKFVHMYTNFGMCSNTVNYNKDTKFIEARYLGTIYLSNYMLCEEVSDEMAIQIARHEVAHALVTHHDPNSHGKEFQRICRRIGCWNDKPMTTSFKVYGRRFWYFYGHIYNAYLWFLGIFNLKVVEFCRVTGTDEKTWLRKH